MCIYIQPSQYEESQKDSLPLAMLANLHLKNGSMHRLQYPVPLKGLDLVMISLRNTNGMPVHSCPNDVLTQIYLTDLNGNWASDSGNLCVMCDQ